ncbi:poly-gamma-glutamate hydrolase family protein [Nonomuraea guangzhouensis]|uniref:Poly-gamma-glutamate hydrolase family protein n=1 Tax=Nonomuraea guangzhouensis TaxID=1291555 RepID=A0ABW4H034_9ACTN|nr:poly-gamma-glutamate hydrolase family protein [Nonomuraea guangzhouensis]
MRATIATSLLFLLLPLTTPQTAHAAVADVYPDYATLAANEVEGQDYLRLLRLPKRATVAHIAIHGGAIESPTTQLADYAAGKRHAFYSFAGIKPNGNNRLHITSTRFDEPRALKLVRAVDYTVSWHAAAGSEATTYVGGRDAKLVAKVTTALKKAGFAVADTVPDRIDGTSPRNIANKNKRGMGVQLEISKGQRMRFFADGKLTRAWVDNPANRTRAFYTYVAAVNRALG